MVDRRHELENLRRSLAMLSPGQVSGLRREDALRLIEDIEQLQARLWNLRDRVRRALEDEPP